jgi:hypothetical protein
MIELAEIFRRHGPEYRQKFEGRMPRAHLKAMEAIEQCRTRALGGHVYRCKDCGEKEYSYHSCKNRHCPKCQNEEASQWLEKQRELLLPVPYYMVTFTLPEELRALARSNQKHVYGMMFRASAQALKELANDRRHLGGSIGMEGVLQTWSRDMTYHPHIHYLMPGGALSPDGTSWIKTRYKDWLVPVKALSKLFRGKLRSMLRRTGLTDKIPRKVWRKKWSVHCKAVGTGEQALKYLAPYIRRIAITNGRIRAFQDGRVTFRVGKGNAGQGKEKTLEACEFIRRFLQHVLPGGFQKVRYYGFLSSSLRDQLQRIKEILPGTDSRQSAQNDCTQPEQADPPVVPEKTKHCRKCGGPLIYLFRLSREKRAPPGVGSRQEKVA